MAARCWTGPSSAKVRLLPGSAATCRPSLTPIGCLPRRPHRKVTRSESREPTEKRPRITVTVTSHSLNALYAAEQKKILDRQPKLRYPVVAFVALVSPLG